MQVWRLLGIAAWMKKLDLKGGSFNAAKDVQIESSPCWIAIAMQ